MFVASGYPHLLGVAAQLVSVAAFPLNAPTAAREAKVISAAAPIAAATSPRLRRPVRGCSSPDSGEAGGSRPVGIFLSFGLVVMTLPSLMFLLSCHDYYL